MSRNRLCRLVQPDVYEVVDLTELPSWELVLWIWPEMASPTGFRRIAWADVDDSPARLPVT